MGEGGVGGLCFKTLQTTTVFAGGVCRASLQSSHLMVRQKKVTAGGRGLEPGPIISGCLQLTPVKTSLAAFALFWGGGGGFRGGLFYFCFGEEKMEPKWTKVLVLLLLFQRRFGWTLNSGLLLLLLFAAGCLKSFRCSFQT